MPFGPELCEALHGRGLPLGDAFRMHVGADAELVELVAGCDGLIFDLEHACECADTLAGMLTAANPMWPPSIRDFDLASEWLDADGAILGKRSPLDKRGFFDGLADDNLGAASYYGLVRSAEARFKLLYADLISHLQTGAVVACGYRFNVDEPSNVPRAIWSSEATRIAFTLNELHRHAGDVIERTGTAPPLRIERTLIDWIGVELAWRDGSGQSTVARDIGGRPPKYNWEGAYNELMCILAIEGLPGTYIKDDLGKLFQRAFENCDGLVPELKQANAWLSNRNYKLWLMMKPARE